MKRLAFLTAASVLLLSACQSGSSTINIGFVGPLTGGAAALGTDMLNGVKLAVDELNAKGGINGVKVKLVAEDGKCTPSEAANAFQKLVNVDKVTVIVGGLCSGETLAGAPIANSAHVVMISPGSSSPKVTDAGDFVFRNYPSDAFRGVAAAKYFKKMGYTHVAMITQNTDYATGLRDSIVANVGSGNIVFNETVEETTQDFRSLLTRLKGMNFDVFIPNMQTDAAVGALVQQFRAAGLPQPIVGNDTSDSLAVAQIAGTASQDVHLIDVPTAGEGQPFEQTFKAKYGAPQSSLTWAAYAYDATNVFFQSMAKVGTGGDAIRDALYQMPDYSGIIGNFHFDKNGDVVGASYVVKKFQSGAIVTVGPIPE